MNEIEFERKFFFLSRKYLEKSFPPFTENVKQNFASLLNPNFTKCLLRNYFRPTVTLENEFVT